MRGVDLGAGIVRLCPLLTVTMPSMKRSIDALRAAAVRDRLQVLLGGAPVTAQFAGAIGPGGCGRNAAEAVPLARRFSPGAAA